MLSEEEAMTIVHAVYQHESCRDAQPVLAA